MENFDPSLPLENLDHETFCLLYVVDANGTRAYIKAFHHDDDNDASAAVMASRLLRNVKVEERISYLTDQKIKRLSKDADYVLKIIIETIERCRQAAPVLDRKGKQVHVKTADGDILPAYEFDSKAVLKGTELLGRHLKMFTDKVEASGPDGGPIPIAIGKPKDFVKAVLDDLEQQY